jgi:hypothetical protein
MTELFVFGGEAPVPPGCRGARAPLGPWRVVGTDEAVLDLPPLQPHSRAVHLLPSLSIATDQDHAFQFAVRARPTAPWTFASAVGPWGPASTEDETQDRGTAGLTADIDVFRATPPIADVSVRVRLRARMLSAVLAAPTLLTVSLSDDVADLPSGSPAGRSADPALSVPTISQMEAPEPLRMRICSPVCVAMVLGYWGHDVDPVTLAEEMRDARHDLYGVWPAAILAAGRRGVHGYLMRFPSWKAAEWCLHRRLPVIASIRYAAGELRGAAVESTPGHLIVLTGIAGTSVLVNDPAAPTRTEVPRAYALEDLQRVWLERSGVGYVLFPPGAATGTS